MLDVCRECVITQWDRIARMAGADDREAAETVEKARSVVAPFPHDGDVSQSPMAMDRCWRALMGDLDPTGDPYGEVKAQYEALVADLGPTIRETVREADNPLATALRFATSGNLIDFGTHIHFGPEEVRSLMESVPDLEFAIDDSASLIEAAKGARTMVYLADNCGESTLDRQLIEAFKEANPYLSVTYVVRERPILNDLTRSEALAAGMDEVAEVVTNGDLGFGAGTILSQVSPALVDALENADVVVSKGQGNYETLHGKLHDRLWFLFMDKCDFIAEDLGIAPMELLCLRNEPAA